MKDDLNCGELIKAVKRNLIRLQEELRSGDLPLGLRHLNDIILALEHDLEEIRNKEDAESLATDQLLDEKAEARADLVSK